MISKLKTNEQNLVKMSIGGYATQPSFKNPGYIPNNDGEAVILSKQNTKGILLKGYLNNDFI